MTNEQIEKLLTVGPGKTIADMTTGIRTLGPKDKDDLFAYIVAQRGGKIDTASVPNYKKMNVMTNEARLRYLTANKKMPDGQPVHESEILRQTTEHVNRIKELGAVAIGPSETKEKPAREVPVKKIGPSETKEKPAREVPVKKIGPSEKKAAPAKEAKSEKPARPAKVKPVKNPDIEVAPTKVHRKREQAKAAKVAARKAKEVEKTSKIRPNKAKTVPAVVKEAKKKVAAAMKPNQKEVDAMVKFVKSVKSNPPARQPQHVGLEPKRRKQRKPVSNPGSRDGYAPTRRYGNGRGDYLDKLILRMRGAYEPHQREEIVKLVVAKFGPWPALQNSTYRTIAQVRSHLFLSGQLEKGTNREHLGRPRA